MADGGRSHSKPTLKRLNTSFRNPLLDIVWTDSIKNVMTKPRELEKLRHVSDSSADECISALHVKAGTDALKVLDDYVSRPTEEQGSAGPKKFMDEITTIPDWVDDDLVRQGQEVFWKYAIPIVVILGNYSLVGIFAASRVVDILSCTNYFSTPDGTYQRLLETTKFVLDIMKDPEALTPIKGVGWASIIRVRMLHTQVRLRVLAEAKRHPNIYDVDELGIPINQEDLLMTLCEFSIAVVNSLRKMGIYPTPNEVKAYLHFWRVIGHFLGISDDYSKHLITESGATAISDSIANHLFDPNEGSVRTAHTLLESMALRAPLFWPLGLHVAVSRVLVGDKISDSVCLEPSPWHWRVIAALVLVFLRWIHCSTLFLQCRLSLTRTCIPRVYEAAVTRKKFEDSHHRRVHCDFTLKFIPHLSHIEHDKVTDDSQSGK